jgi:hypothetical protein
MVGGKSNSSNPEITQPARYKKFPTLRTIKNTRNTRLGDLRSHGDRKIFANPSQLINEAPRLLLFTFKQCEDG